MKILIKFKNGVSDVIAFDRVREFTKNPCLKCRSDGGCYGHGCFDSEDWGTFLDLGNGNSIKTDDISDIKILSF